MDAFEDIVAGLFRQQGYWTRQNYKLDVTRDEKRAIGKPSMPRPEIDILAYKPVTNRLLWIECKSYLDSHGVQASSFHPGDKYEGRYKIFTDARYRQIALERLMIQTHAEGLTLPAPEVKFCLAAGKVYSGSRELLHQWFEERGWLFFDDRWIKTSLLKLAELGYENDVAVIVAKLFARE
jgi:hypothetical protein